MWETDAAARVSSGVCQPSWPQEQCYTCFNETLMYCRSCKVCPLNLIIAWNDDYCCCFSSVDIWRRCCPLVDGPFKGRYLVVLVLVVYCILTHLWNTYSSYTYKQMSHTHVWIWALISVFIHFYEDIAVGVLESHDAWRTSGSSFYSTTVHIPQHARGGGVAGAYTSLPSQDINARSNYNQSLGVGPFLDHVNKGNV